MQEQEWYLQLIKPNWAPPAWLFGPAWMFLYAIITISFGAIFYYAITKKISAKIAIPFVLNLIFNFAFVPIQFGLQNNLLASVDILLVLGTLIWGFKMIWQKAPNLKWVVIVNTPYFLWVSFATILQLTITYLNRS